MKIAIIGTGSVGQALSARLISIGHEVIMGTRNVEETLSRTEKDMYGNPGFADWYRTHGGVKLVTIAHAIAAGEIIINATLGINSVTALKSANVSDLDGKIIIDIANPLDFSKGMPPSLIPGLSNTHSLGEEIQKAFPKAKVVKTLNTMNCNVMVNPKMVGNGDHHNFICGNDQGAKDLVKSLLKEFGWTDETLIDLGDITAARCTEGILPLWVRILVTKQTAAFNFKITG
jgi:predicted dinucleotide-binding enzyme